MIKVGIVGGTGYTGVELLRLLAQHSDAQVEVITSRSEAGVPVADMYPNLRGHYDIKFTEPDSDALAACDVVFFATPHGVAHSLAGEILAKGSRVIDLSADFRLRDPDLWAQWYNQPHGAPELLKEAVYGLPETQREAIKNARLVAVPGCYPTAVQLAALPLLESGLVKPEIVADCKSGVSGAGRGAKVGSLLCETSESVMAYGASGHRHLPEINQELARGAGKDIDLTFVPHLMPMIRGIHATVYADLHEGQDVDLQALYEKRYKDEPFVDVMPAGSHPSTRSVRGVNMCRISLHRPQNGKKVVVLSVIDNLVKGASGQAIQNMNLMFGLDEKTGLNQIGLMP